MTKAIVIVITLLVVVPAGAGSGSSLRAKPALKLVSMQPLTVRGLRFDRTERVLVRVLAPKRATKRVSATRAGTFVARFTSVSLDRCSALMVVAVGSKGARASLKGPQPVCPPSLRGG